MSHPAHELFFPDHSGNDKLLQDGLNLHALEAGGVERTPIGIYLHDDEGQVIGGVHGHLMPHRLSIKLLWVEASRRGQGLGAQLMRLLEERAQKEKVERIYVDTLSYQGPEFYPRLGYHEVARIRGFYAGHDRIFFEKDIA